MRIKSLELNGFKSFIDRTVLRFERGITAVVGPNGCGKSNVVDAMRWAMGEQSPRRLRGKSMEDVIFAGSEGRAAVNLAEVVITFDNSDGSGPPAFSGWNEIQVARRLYRSGESEYFLNQTPCRLRDVHDLFRDSGMGAKGYTIVEQGHIAEIVSAKPEDRRELIEEAAGIGKYKARRREAESKIRSTEQNLLRVTDVLTEIRRQINAIERQAKKAARYKRLRETWRVLELSLAADDRRELVAEAADARERQRGLLGAADRPRDAPGRARARARAAAPRARRVRARALAGHRGAAGVCAATSRTARAGSSSAAASARTTRTRSPRGARSSRSCARSSRPRTPKRPTRAPNCARSRPPSSPNAKPSRAPKRRPAARATSYRPSNASATRATPRWSRC